MSINLDSLDEETRNKIINLQNLQRSLEFIMNQKLQMESSLRETELTIEELDKSSPETVVYKSIGGIMVKSERDKLLDEKKSLKVTLEMRMKTLAQKEERVKSQVNTMRNSLQKDLGMSNQ